MMQQSRSFAYAEVPGAKLLSMPYEGGGFSMVFVLPNEVDGLEAIKRSLTAAALEAWTAELQALPVEVEIPRFTSTQSHSLAEPLGKLGMKRAFGSGADFSGMDGAHVLSIDSVTQKAFIKLDEAGTEAAAATGVTMVIESMRISPRSFIADHPFLYVLRDKRGNVVFMGRTVDPTS